MAKLSQGLGKLSDLGLSGLLTSSGLPGRPRKGVDQGQQQGVSWDQDL